MSRSPVKTLQTSAMSLLEYGSQGSQLPASSQSAFPLVAPSQVQRVAVTTVAPKDIATTTSHKHKLFVLVISSPFQQILS